MTKIRFKHLPILAWAVLATAPAQAMDQPILYQYRVTPTALIDEQCQEGMSRIAVDPVSSQLKAPEGYRGVTFSVSLCTFAGFRTMTQSIFLPEEILAPEFPLSIGVGQKKSWDKVPSAQTPGLTSTVTITRKAKTLFVLTWSNSSNGDNSDLPVDIVIGSEEEMSPVGGWRPGDLLWKMIRVRYQRNVFLPVVVMEGTLARVDIP